MPSDRNLTDNNIELLSAYLDGELSAAERAALETRLEAEPALRAELRTLRKTVELVKLMPAAKAPRSFTLTHDMVRAARQPRVLMFPATAWVSSLSAAAAVVLVVAGVALLTLNSASRAPMASVANAPTQQSIANLATDEMLEDAVTANAFGSTVVIPAVPTFVAQPTQAIDVEPSRERDNAEGADVLTDQFSLQQSQVEEMESVEEAADDAADEAQPPAVMPFAPSDAQEEFDRDEVPFAAQIPQDGQIPTGRGGAGGPQSGGGGGGADVGAGFDAAAPAPDVADAIGQQGDAANMAEPSIGMVAPAQQDDARLAATVVETAVDNAQSAAGEAAEDAAGASIMMEQEAPEEAPMMEMAQLATETPTDEPTLTPTDVPTATQLPTNTPPPTPTTTPTPAAIVLPDGAAGIVGIVLIVLGIMAFGLFAMTRAARRRGG